MDDVEVMGGMAEIVGAHQGYETLTRIGGYTVDCLGCDWRTFSALMPNEDLLHAAHVADELAKAGFGRLIDAQIAAWEDGKLSYFETTLTGQPICRNPYLPEAP